MPTSSMNVTVMEIMSEFQPKGILLEVLGDKCKLIDKISSIEDCGPGDLVFVDKTEYIEVVKSRHPSAIVTTPALTKSIGESQHFAVLVAPSVSLAHAHLKQKYAGRDFTASGWTNVHPSAVIHPTAELASSVVVEPNAVVGARTKIGKNSRLMAGVVIENDVVIGDDCVVHPHAFVGYGCRLGSQVVVGPGTVIGSEGFGFAQDAKRKSHSIPQTGVVVIEDRVSLGANNCIDRAAYRETRIGAGTKIDNLCHIAHNVQVGEDCLLTAMLCVAGSTTIGSRVMTSGQAGILDHKTICSDTVLLHRAGVTKDIETPGVYAGLPLLPLSDYLKNAAILRNANDLKKRLTQIEKALGIN